jgi:ATP-dependent helicase/nuclease subunit A
MSQSPHLLIRASAGTGKTYRLSGRFLELLIAGVQPERILATTFTRKAAGEILDRVLEWLVEAIEDEEACAELASATRNPELDASACSELLARLTRNLHSFQVRTIDSFFVHLVQLFALDLEMPSDWKICDERVDERLRSEALQDVLAQENAEELLLLLRELSKGGAGRSVQQKLLDESRKLRPALLESEPEAWDSFATGTEVGTAELRKAVAGVEAAPLPTTAKDEPNKNWLKARDAFLLRVHAEQWEDLVSNGGLGAAYLSEEQTYYKIPFPPELLEALKPLMRHGIHRVLTELRARNIAGRSLTETFEQAYQARKRSEGSFGFADLPHAIAPCAAGQLPIDERELDMWFRLDGRIDHLLLDEFQDTSPVQWRILAPIASEITSVHDGQRSLFCVGDVKQSIYSFRHAEPRLLGQLQRILPGLEAESMDLSYRSSEVVLSSVNLIFSGMGDNSELADDGLSAYRTASRRWLEGFRDHEAARDIPGAVRLIEVPESEDPTSALIATTVRRIAQVVNEAPDASVGILFRKRKLIPRLIHQLREHDIDASGEGGTPLTDSRSVLAFLSLLHLTDYPEDSAAAFHVASSPFGRYVGLDESTSINDLSRGLRQRLALEGLGEFTRHFAALVSKDDSWSPWDRARFAQLLDQAFVFEVQGEHRPSAFVDHVRSNSAESPGGSSVRVMTIHASKGLEFDAVLLPELGGDFANLRSSLHTYRAEPEALFERVSLAVKKGFQPLSPELKMLYENNTMSSVEDSLCVLYVAMTRAARLLEMIVPWKDPNKNSTVPATHQVLRAALAGHGLHEPDEEGLIWEHPDSAPGAGWCEGLAEVQPPPAARSAVKLKLARQSAPRSLTRRSPSAEEGGGQVHAGDVLRSNRGASVGTLVHACFEDLTWIEQFEFDAERLSRLPELRNADSGLRETALKIVSGALENEAVRSALSREMCEAPESTELQVLAEERFALTIPNEDGVQELWTGSIDRLVLAREGDQTVYAEIIDYKTDRVDPERLDARVEHYAPQLRRYRQVVAARTGLDAESIRTRLVFLGMGEVRDVV